MIRTKKKNVYKYSLGENVLLWLPEWNKYILTNPPVDKVISMILENQSSSQIREYCIRQVGMQQIEAVETEDSFREFISSFKKEHDIKNTEAKYWFAGKNEGRGYYSQKFYCIGKQTFQVDYPDARIEDLIHPKFEHLQVISTEVVDNYLQISFQHNKYYLFTNGVHISNWIKEDEHLLSGKFSMQVLQKIYEKEEDRWIGVFHAAGITDGKSCVMFLGDSGNGKSTLSAILLANGFDVLSDDFLPVEASANLVCRFPAAISVKKTAYEIISEQFPQLLQFKEYNNPVLNKTFRYLPVPHIDMLCVPCRALVFVKYSREGDLKFEEMPQAEAFQHLVPDTWISPKTENSQKFVEWFKRLPCYRLTYSNNKTMVETVTKLFDDLS